MGMKTATTATVEKKVRKARGIDTEKVAALIREKAGFWGFGPEPVKVSSGEN